MAERPRGPGSFDEAVATELRTATPDDIPGVLAFWLEAAEPTSTDSADALTGLLRRDPGALIVAVAGDHIVGSVIAGWDGWRGSVYRLVVAPEHRRHGLGRALLRAAEDHLAEFGARRSHAIVVGTSAGAVGFWRATDWEHQSGQLRFAKG
jgi:ribosomal protein S18 acetylase RimI-like enzyme